MAWLSPWYVPKIPQIVWKELQPPVSTSGMLWTHIIEWLDSVCTMLFAVGIQFLKTRLRIGVPAYLFLFLPSTWKIQMHHANRLDWSLDRPKFVCLDFPLCVFGNMSLDFLGNLGNYFSWNRSFYHPLSHTLIHSRQLLFQWGST